MQSYVGTVVKERERVHEQVDSIRRTTDAWYENALQKIIQIYEEQQFGLDRGDWQAKKEYPKKIAKWKGALNHPSLKNYKVM